MRKAAVSHPIISSFIISLLFFIAMFLGSLLLSFAPAFFRSNGSLLMQFTAETVVCIAGVIVAAIFGYLKAFDSTSKFLTGIACSGYFIVTYLFSAAANLLYELESRGIPDFIDDLVPFWQFLMLPLTVLAIGFAEECFFRGVIANLFFDRYAKNPAGVWTAAIYSGLFFGFMHIINVLASEPSGVLVQITSVTAMGIAMTAIYYRCRNIWVMILLHAFLDGAAMLPLGLFGGSISSEISDYTYINALTWSIPYIIVACFLLRKKKAIEIVVGELPENSMGIIPQSGQLVVGMDMPSDKRSKRSLAIAITVAIVLCLITFAGSMALDPSVQNSFKSAVGIYALDYSDSGTFNSESYESGVEGHSISFSVDKSKDYSVQLIAIPSDSRVDMVMQIKKDGEVIYESTYGGKCTTTFGVHLDSGDYELILVYTVPKDGSNIEYNTTVKIS